MCTLHMHTHAHMHICKLICVCVFAQTRYLWYLAPPRSPLPYAAYSPQLGGMVEILVALSGAIGSGDGHLPQNLGYRFGSNAAVAGKPETGQSSGPIPVDFGYDFGFVFVFLIVAAWLAARCCGLYVWKHVSFMERGENKEFI